MNSKLSSKEMARQKDGHTIAVRTLDLSMVAVNRRIPLSNPWLWEKIGHVEPSL
jgi:hypothetical protein